jgi:O-antigen/teichoic acid export membrane protein
MRLNLAQQGTLFAAAGLLAGAGNYVFQGVMGRILPIEEYGLALTSLGTAGAVGLPVGAASMALTHYIAQLRSRDETERLGALVAGSRRLLLRITLAVTVLALLLIRPVGAYFEIPRSSLTFAMLSAALGTVWTAFAGAWFMGMARFDLLAGLSLAGVALRVGVGLALGKAMGNAEAACYATAAAALVYLALMRHRRPSPAPAAAPPWDREFVRYLLVCAAYSGGMYAFMQGDLLAAQKHLTGEARGVYSAAGTLGRALVFAAGPLLSVLFTARSEHRSDGSRRDQLLLLAMHSGILATGAVVITLLAPFLVQLLLGKSDPAVQRLVAQFALVMVPIGLLQAVATSALAARRETPVLVFGLAGLGYWAWLMVHGHSPDALLAAMRTGALVSLGVVAGIWFLQRQAQKNSSRPAAPPA